MTPGLHVCAVDACPQDARRHCRRPPATTDSRHHDPHPPATTPDARQPESLWIVDMAMLWDPFEAAQRLTPNLHGACPANLV
ncbi:hypothetical protein U9M48_022640 [Paspalum notatum var. saurae]|uniref:Uncharacterized protein n=1 Tax=Paspalum notatum var. saurae TaxID=547442 RepID=A0AAQ3TJZ4_PASNO